MYILILLVPCISFLLITFLGFYFGREGVIILSVFGQLLTFLVVVLCFYEVVLCDSPVYLDLWTWLYIDIFHISFSLYFDSLTCFMLFIISLISTCVQFYSVGYMQHDPHIARFFGYLSLFTFFMLVLVTADNFLQLFIGWEGVGVCSFLLISFWYTRILAVKAAIKAMIMNRIADVFFIIAIILIVLNFKSLSFPIVFNLISFSVEEKIFFVYKFINKLDLICFFLFVGAIGKSAQVGLHTWLPDAMEGPTPVSALLHAATMVTAGVFLIIRCSFFFEYSATILLLICLFGGLTCFFSGLIGCFVYDVKKIIAYSTCSQLGYMFFSSGLSKYDASIFHLFNHAFFKALLFLSAGALIHALRDEQDLRKMGSLINFLPFTYFCFFLGSLVIMGFPFLTAFYSKDMILEFAYARYILDSAFIYLLGIVSAFFTCFYSFRLIFFVFFNEYNGFKFFIKENDFFIFLPMFILSFCSVFMGFLFFDIFLGLGTPFFGNALFTLVFHYCYLDCEVLSPFLKNLPIYFFIFGCFFGYFAYALFHNVIFEAKGSILYHWFIYFLDFIVPLCSSAFFFNFFYNFFFRFFYLHSYEDFTKRLEKGFFEVFGSFGFYNLIFFFFFDFFKITFHYFFFNLSFLFIFLFFCFWMIFFFKFFILGLTLVFFFKALDVK